MNPTRIPNDQIGRVARELYATTIGPLVETQKNIGKILSVDVESGDYEIGDEILETGTRVLKRRPNASLFYIRIGYDAVLAVGGTISRTVPVLGAAE